MIIANAAAALLAAEETADLKVAVERVTTALKDGTVRAKLEELKAWTQTDAS